MRICVFAASSDRPASIYKDEAFHLGACMAQKGYGLVFGGGAHGLMGAVARGVQSSNGEIIGIAPTFFDEPGILFEDCTEFIFTEGMRERKKFLQEKSDACIVLPGGIGTYEEFFEVLVAKQLGRIARPIVLLNTNGYYDALQAFMQATIDEKFTSEYTYTLYYLASSPEDALEYLENYVPTSGSIFKLEDH